MKTLDVKDWFEIADDDYESAVFLMSKYRKPIEIICYHLIQAVEKYLKAFIQYKGITPQKTHNIEVLLNKCISFDKNFLSIKKECFYINSFTHQLHYEKRGEIAESDMEICLKYTEIVKNFHILQNIRKEIEENV